MDMIYLSYRHTSLSAPVQNSKGNIWHFINVIRTPSRGRSDRCRGKEGRLFLMKRFWKRI
jgi:hypothetical protein